MARNSADRAASSPASEATTTAAPVEAAAPAERAAERSWWMHTLTAAAPASGRYTIVWLVIAAFIVLSLTNSNFASKANIETILRQASYVGIGGAGMTYLIIAGSFDLSVAGELALAAVVGATFVPQIGLAGAVAAALVAGAVLGLLNGLVVTRLRVPAFVATLGMGYVYLAVTFVWTNDHIVIITDPGFLELGTGSLGPLPLPFLLMTAACLCCWLLLRFTRYGRFTRAVGSNRKAARAAAVPVVRVEVFGFVVVGVLTALAGLALAGQLSSANATMATGYELQAITVAVIGGTSLSGGSGTLLGTFAGALFLEMIGNALELFGLGSYWQYVASGLVLIVALALAGLRNKLGGRR